MWKRRTSELATFQFSKFWLTDIQSLKASHECWNDVDVCHDLVVATDCPHIIITYVIIIHQMTYGTMSNQYRSSRALCSGTHLLRRLYHHIIVESLGSKRFIICLLDKKYTLSLTVWVQKTLHVFFRHPFVFVACLAVVNKIQVAKTVIIIMIIKIMIIIMLLLIM